MWECIPSGVAGGSRGNYGGHLRPGEGDAMAAYVQHRQMAQLEVKADGQQWGGVLKIGSQFDC
eukprot:1149008-Pelagomonas_calceolata.AAC.3